jgi:shikimate kinase/3-dehydroquinate synthase
MAAGKTSIGRRLAARLGLPVRDADSEIEQAAGCTIPELFARYGERDFRDGERRVIRRLLGGEPIVLATGGGAFMDPETRATIRRSAVSVWLRCPLPVLLRRVGARHTRPLLAEGDPAEILQRLRAVRDPVYAEADLTIDCGDETPEVTTGDVLDALLAWTPPRRLSVSLAAASYEVVVGDGLLARAGALLAPVLPQKRVVIVTDATVAALHLAALESGLRETAIESRAIVVPAGETSKTLDVYARVVDELLGGGVERRTGVVALGGGVVGDLAGFAAATTLRGLPFVQVPTTLLAQVDSSVGGKTGVNTARGKNLVGAFHQPLMVLADTATLATLPARELRAGYAEIAKAGLIGDAAFFAWCEQHGAAVVGGDRATQAEAIARAGGGARLRRDPARRGGGGRAGAGVPAFRAARAVRGGRCGASGAACRRGWPAGGAGDAEPAAVGGGAGGAHAARQEGARPAADLRAGTRHRPSLHQPRGARARGGRPAARRRLRGVATGRPRRSHERLICSIGATHSHRRLSFA